MRPLLQDERLEIRTVAAYYASLWRDPEAIDGLSKYIDWHALSAHVKPGEGSAQALSDAADANVAYVRVAAEALGRIGGGGVGWL